MSDIEKPVIVEFPLRGEWMAPNTPGSKVPSHGTGHAGNSTAHHLHFHLMDNSDMLEANGIPCAFEKYEVFQENTWATVNNGIPKANDRIRFFK